MAFGFNALYARTEKAAGSREAMWLLGAVSFGESAFLPIPVDAVSVPIMLSSRKRIPAVIVVATISSVLGGLLGYFLGWGFYEAIAEPMLRMFGVLEQVGTFTERLQQDKLTGAWLIFLGGVTPIPFKVVCIGAGLVKFNVPLFLAAAFAGRTLRFIFFGVLFWYFGETIRNILRNHSWLLTVILIIVIVGGFLSIGAFV